MAVPSTSAGSVRVVTGAKVGGRQLRLDGAPRVRSFVRFGRVPKAGGRIALEVYVLSGRPGTRVAVRAVTRRTLRRALRSGRALRRPVVASARLGRVPGWLRLDVSAAAASGSAPVFMLSSSARDAVTLAGRRSAHRPRLRLGVPPRGVGVTPPSGSPTAGGAGGTPPVGSSAGSFLPQLPPPPYVPPIPQLPAATRFLSPSGSDDSTCTQAAPCRSLDRAYKVARPGEVVELAGGGYGAQTITRDATKTGAGCASANNPSACVVFRAAAGSTAAFGSLKLGPGGRVDGPSGIMLVADADRQLTSGYTDVLQAHETVIAGVRHVGFYIAGTTDVSIVGGEVGPLLSSDGTHPEVQRVYGTNPLIVPQNLTIQGVWFHDINTTHPTAHVDCLQVENGTNVVIRGNRFDRCGSVGLRMSYGVETSDGPPTNVLIENNVFGYCARIPVSPCYYAAQLGVGRDVLIRNNSSVQELQPTGSETGTGIRYIGNVAPGLSCEAAVAYSHNVWGARACGATDKRSASLGFADPAAADLHSVAGSPAIGAGDPASFAATDADGVARPVGAAPDAGAYER